MIPNPFELETLHTLAQMDFGHWAEGYMWYGPDCFLVYLLSSSDKLPAIVLNLKTQARHELPSTLLPYSLKQELSKLGWQPGYGYRKQSATPIQKEDLPTKQEGSRSE